MFHPETNAIFRDRAIQGPSRVKFLAAQGRYRVEVSHVPAGNWAPRHEVRLDDVNSGDIDHNMGILPWNIMGTYGNIMIIVVIMMTMIKIMI